MSTITGGVVSVEDGTKKNEEYAPARKVRVELRFDVPEGANHEEHLNSVATLAHAKVNELLGQKAAPVAPATTEAPKPVGRPKKPPTQPAPEAQGPTKADLERQHAASLGASPAEVEAITGEQAKPQPKPKEDTLDDLTGDATPPAKEITDKDLVSATTKKNEVLKSAVKIRALVETFADPGKKIAIREIPQARRQEYLDKLEALS